MFDLTIPRLKRTLFLGTRWGEEHAKLVPAPGDPFYLNYTYKPMDAPLAPPPPDQAAPPGQADRSGRRPDGIGHAHAARRRSRAAGGAADHDVADGRPGDRRDHQPGIRRSVRRWRSLMLTVSSEPS